MQKITPVNYNIRIEPDLVNFTFAGTAQILLNVLQPVKEILMNLLDIAVWSCKVLENSTFVGCPFFVDSPKEELRIFLHEAMTGNISLRID